MVNFMTDPISDLLIRIKNGYQARRKIVNVSHSKAKENICQLLVKNGYLKSLKIKKAKFKELELGLKYEAKKPALTAIKLISKPSLRVYKRAVDIPRVRMGHGITLVSTPAGLKTGKEAKKINLGGEVICQIW